MEVLRYPTWRYHHEHKAVIVNTPEEEAERTPETDGWCDSPTVAAKRAEKFAQAFNKAPARTVKGR